MVVLLQFSRIAIILVKYMAYMQVAFAVVFPPIIMVPLYAIITVITMVTFLVPFVLVAYLPQ